MACEAADPCRRDPDGGSAQARAAETARPSDRTMACETGSFFFYSPVRDHASAMIPP